MNSTDTTHLIVCGVLSFSSSCACLDAGRFDPQLIFDKYPEPLLQMTGMKLTVISPSPQTNEFYPGGIRELRQHHECLYIN